MSGKENYVDGKEALQFFSSIQLKETSPIRNVVFTPAQGGFSVKLPVAPDENLNTNTTDGINRWEYEAHDNTTGDSYLILKKSVFNFKFLEEDSFDLKLIEESFRSPDHFDKQLSRKPGTWLGYPCLDVKESMKNGNTAIARYIIVGPHYYCLAVSTKDTSRNFDDFFNSFRFTPYQYNTQSQYVDTFLHFSVTTPVPPDLDESYRAKLEKVSADVANSNANSGYSNYWPRSKNALFTSDSTGETIGVSVQQYPKYYFVKDPPNFWKNEINEYSYEGDLFLYKNDSFRLKDGTFGYRFVLRDTGSSRTINRMTLQKDNYMFSLVTIGDTLNQHNDFINQFFSSFTPEEKKLGKDIFINNLDSFFADLFSKDSTVHSKAQKIISNVYYGEKGVPKIVSAINALKPDKDYMETKARLIAELGYIKDTTKRVIVSTLKRIYEQTADTSIFQNEVLKALARHKTKEATKLFKELALQDPPFFENNYDYTAMFSNLGDSLELAATLYPELLQLATVDDYKGPVLSLLVTLVDSGYLKNKQFEDYFNKIYFDAKIELKKQQGKDEKKIDEEKDRDDDDESTRGYNNVNDNKNELSDYAILLMPFYDKNKNAPKFFDKLLRSKDDGLRLSTIILLLRHNKPVDGSSLLWFAERDKWRGTLYSKLEQIKKLDKFPPRYKTQVDIARSYMVEDKDYNSIDSIVLIGKQSSSYRGKRGYVYFFKYRVKREDDWKIGLSGLQPENTEAVSSDNKLSVMTDKKLKTGIPQNEQFQEQLKRIQFTFHKSARNFFGGDNSFRVTKNADYQER